MAPKRFYVEIIMPDPHCFTWLCWPVKPGTTIGQALTQSGIAKVKHTSVGIWGEAKTAEWVLSEGDRIEIIQPLLTDPKLVRKTKALQEARDFRKQRQTEKENRLMQKRAKALDPA